MLNAYSSHTRWTVDVDANGVLSCRSREMALEKMGLLALNDVNSRRDCQNPVLQSIEFPKRRVEWFE